MGRELVDLVFMFTFIAVIAFDPKDLRQSPVGNGCATPYDVRKCLLFMALREASSTGTALAIRVTRQLDDLIVQFGRVRL